MIAERAYSEQNERSEFRERSGKRRIRHKEDPRGIALRVFCFVGIAYRSAFMVFLFSYMRASARRKIAP